MLKRQYTVGFPGANISDQSQACETRSCLFLYLCSEVDICTDIVDICTDTVDICTDIYTAHCCSVVFVSLLKISELYIISKSYGGSYKKHIITAHVLQQTPYRLYYYCCTDAGFPGANIGDQSRACETRSCLFLCPCIGVDTCTDIHTEYSTHWCVVLYHF